MKDLPSPDTAAPELMLHSLSVVKLVTCPDRHFAQTPCQKTCDGKAESEQNGDLAMRDYSKTGIPVVVDREDVVDVAIDAVVVDVDRDVVVVVVVDVDRDAVVDDGMPCCCAVGCRTNWRSMQHLENLKVRQSLGETPNSLENHEIQLALAMQDLMVATSEIKKATKIREQLNQLER